MRQGAGDFNKSHTFFHKSARPQTLQGVVLLEIVFTIQAVQLVNIFWLVTNIGNSRYRGLHQKGFLIISNSRLDGISGIGCFSELLVLCYQKCKFFTLDGLCVSSNNIIYRSSFRTYHHCRMICR